MDKKELIRLAKLGDRIAQAQLNTPKEKKLEILRWCAKHGPVKTCKCLQAYDKRFENAWRY